MSDKRPFDMLNSSVDKEVLIQLKEGREIKGTLRSFDAHMNLVLEDAKDLKTDKKLSTMLVRGDNILFISSSA